VTPPDTDSLITQTKNPTVTYDDPPMGLTENMSLTYLSTGNPCLDFFFHILPDTPSDQVIERLPLAWSHDPLTTLKLICNLRGVRGTGKSDKEGFYTSAFWLYRNHPKTLSLNARVFTDFGYLKDLPEILYRILEGPEIRKVKKQEWIEKKRGKKAKRAREGKFKRQAEEKTEVGDIEGDRLIKNIEEMGCVISKEQARALRKERDIAKAKRALDKYKSDPNYRFLYDCVADVFAHLLKSDMNYLRSNELFKISLASKWCPSIDSSFDKATLICEGIARRVFPRESEKEYEGIQEAHYAYRVRERLRKEVLVPLHKVLELPEVFMSANEWNSLPYTRVASVAMKNYKGLFLKHDGERFYEYLENVKSGKAKIAAGALLPHQIIAALKDDDGGKVAELQWARIVEDLSKKGKLKNCMAVCDVSGSMEGIPMEVSVALGLLVSELSEEPWKGKLITFSEDPELHMIEGDTLLAKAEFVRMMDWGGSTAIQKVFDRILEVAIENKLSEDQLIKRLFVFSDMEFDHACGNSTKIEVWETDYQLMQRKFRESGYNKLPEIVFWNLRNSSSTPVAKQSGVALVSGFSKNLLTLFLEEDGIVNPKDVMELAIAGEEYKKLVVYD
ncbi:LOW QUALITY PROTEIN: DUF2828 domain-containing protein, partial [Cephalotus follicularis]